MMRKEELKNVRLTGRVPESRARGRQMEKYMNGKVRAEGGDADHKT